MNTILPLAKALGDESRIRALMMLRDGELCVCQIIETLKLAPATVSKHLSILHEAGMVHRQKRGKWAFYRLAGEDAAPAVRQVLKWLFDHLKTDAQVTRDARTLCDIREVDLTQITRCYSEPAKPKRTRAAAGPAAPARTAAAASSRTTARTGSRRPTTRKM